MRFKCTGDGHKLVIQMNFKAVFTEMRLILKALPDRVVIDFVMLKKQNNVQNNEDKF